jgi:hypothetical protein
MMIAGRYPFKGADQFIQDRWPNLLIEIEEVIKSVDARKHLTKRSREKTMRGRKLYSPRALNTSFKKEFLERKWTPAKIKCQYSSAYYVPGYMPGTISKGAFREMDFVKDKLGLEVQLGKYAFMVYNVCAKMTIFHKNKIIDAGVEIVPMKKFASRMSTGVSYFEQIVWDLEQRGVAGIDIPVLVIGIDTEAEF